MLDVVNDLAVVVGVGRALLGAGDDGGERERDDEQASGPSYVYEPENRENIVGLLSSVLVDLQGEKSCHTSHGAK